MKYLRVTHNNITKNTVNSDKVVGLCAYVCMWNVKQRRSGNKEIVGNRGTCDPVPQLAMPVLCETYTDTHASF